MHPRFITIFWRRHYLLLLAMQFSLWISWHFMLASELNLYWIEDKKNNTIKIIALTFLNKAAWTVGLHKCINALNESWILMNEKQHWFFFGKKYDSKKKFCPIHLEVYIFTLSSGTLQLCYATVTLYYSNLIACYIGGCFCVFTDANWHL